MVFMQFNIFKDLIHDLCVARRLIVGLNNCDLRTFTY